MERFRLLPRSIAGKLSLLPVRTDYMFFGKGFVAQHGLVAGSYRVMEPRVAKHRHSREMVLVTDHSIVATTVSVIVP
jgi:hypothetical protein